MELVKLPTGVSLEVELTTPPLPNGNSGGIVENKLAVCLHPWSWLGGQMDDPVLLSLVDQLEAGNYHVLRYNSRGVGKSTGWASFTGFNEAQNLKELVKWALEAITGVVSLVLIGYSHGSLIASLHPTIPTVKTSHVLISYPLGTRGLLTLFHTSTYAKEIKELVQDVNSNILILYGDQDEFTAVSKYRAWKEVLQSASESSNKIMDSKLQVVEIAEASHFWRGRASQRLQEVISGWLP